MPTPRSNPGRCVRDEPDARALLDLLRASGQPLKAWCRSNELNARSLAWWRTNIRELELARLRRRIAPEEVRLAEVSRSAPLAACELRAEAPARYELELPNRVLIRLDARFDEASLERLLAVVARC